MKIFLIKTKHKLKKKKLNSMNLKNIYKNLFKKILKCLILCNIGSLSKINIQFYHNIQKNS